MMITERAFWLEREVKREKANRFKCVYLVSALSFNVSCVYIFFWVHNILKASKVLTFVFCFSVISRYYMRIIKTYLFLPFNFLFLLPILD